eukprot:7384733-Prymnesium_polylepis.1
MASWAEALVDKHGRLLLRHLRPVRRRLPVGQTFGRRQHERANGLSATRRFGCRLSLLHRLQEGMPAGRKDLRARRPLLVRFLGAGLGVEVGPKGIAAPCRPREVGHRSQGLLTIRLLLGFLFVGDVSFAARPAHDVSGAQRPWNKITGLARSRFSRDEGTASRL